DDDRLELEVVSLERNLGRVLAGRQRNVLAFESNAPDHKHHVAGRRRDGEGSVILDGGADLRSLYRHLARGYRLLRQGVDYSAGDDSGLRLGGTEAQASQHSEEQT